MKQQIRNIARKFGYDIIRADSTRVIGIDPWVDMLSFIQNDSPLIFDVGAHLGQTCLILKEKFPRCTIHSFEPSPTSFAKLKQRVSRLKNVNLWNCGLGAAAGQMVLFENSSSDMSSFLALGNSGWGKVVKKSLVELKTIDQFRQDNNIDHIDILKSDTQGFDLKVFKGAENTIQSDKIGMVYFEFTFCDMYQNLPSFEELYSFLTNRGFLFGSFYKYYHHCEYYYGRLPAWTDALFVHKSYIRPHA